MPTQIIVANAEEIKRTIERLVYEILERKGECRNLALLGIQRRGVIIAARIREILEEKLGHALPFGELDINLYRDDWTTLDHKPIIGHTDIPFDLKQYEVLLVDDVLFTGRTIRAALEALGDHGRPQKVELLALIDRGHRELPIQADFVGKVVPTEREDHVDVTVVEIDGEDAVTLNAK
ncbi:MAG: bifunctional pyr operon transcriptional regulator/uracil phosphoribosyltransferase PyrR [Desulfovibrionaceae bacterium]|nr:bifunctional pyr operon transcriptional regulator/uracil phosphoribosyltransferase PyrR [Desulfovibrionaceae bacterium]